MQEQAEMLQSMQQAMQVQRELRKPIEEEHAGRGAPVRMVQPAAVRWHHQEVYTKGAKLTYVPSGEQVEVLKVHREASPIACRCLGY